MISRRYRFILPILTILILVGILETIARVGKLGDWPPVDVTRGFLPYDSLFRESPGAGGEAQLSITDVRMAALSKDRPQFNPQTFPRKKGPTEFRIICLGGSFTYGYPFDDRFSFPRLLEVGLKALKSEVNWRVINMGAPGYGSYRLRLIADELALLEPDLAVVTVGNNEAMEFSFGEMVFRYGKSWAKFRGQMAKHSRFVAWLAQASDINKTKREQARSPRDRHFKHDSQQRKDLVRNYAENISIIRDSFLDQGAAVYLTSVPVNLRTCQPFGRDAPGDKLGSRDAQLRQQYRAVVTSIQNGQYAEAQSQAEELLQRVPDSASVWYASAVALDNLRRWDEAAEAYTRANELDQFILRSFPSLAEATGRVARVDNTGFVDFVAAVRSVYPIPGSDAFMDNCHPRREVSPLLALSLAGKMVADGYLELPPGWEEEFQAAVEDYLGRIELSPRDEVDWMKVMLWYYRTIAPNERIAAEYQDRIIEVDPEGKYLDPKFKRSYFR